MSKMAHHPENTFFPAGVRSDAVTFPQDRPFPDQPHGHACAPRNIIVPPVDAAGDRWPDDYLDGVPPLNQDIATQGQQRDIGYNDAEYHDVVHHSFAPPAGSAIPNEYREQGINNHAGITQDIPAQAQAVAPVDLVIDMADRPAQNAPAGPAPAFLNELLNQRPVPDEQLNQVLRQLANYFLNQLDSDIDMLQVEPSLAGRTRVFITLNIG